MAEAFLSSGSEREFASYSSYTETNVNAPNVFLSDSRSDEARELLEMDEQQLMQLLVQRLNAIQKNVDLSLQPTFEVEPSPLEKITLPLWIQKTVDVMVQTALRQSYNVICSSKTAYSDLRKQLLGALGVGAGAKKRRRSVEERRKIVEATLQPGASVSRVARRHDVNANQVFHWRKLYREGRLGDSTTTKLLPVRVADERAVGGAERDGNAWRSGTMEIQLAKGTLRIAGAVDVSVLRAAIECMAG